MNDEHLIKIAKLGENLNLKSLKAQENPDDATTDLVDADYKVVARIDWRYCSVNPHRLAQYFEAVQPECLLDFIKELRSFRAPRPPGYAPAPMPFAPPSPPSPLVEPAEWGDPSKINAVFVAPDTIHIKSGRHDLPHSTDLELELPPHWGETTANNTVRWHIPTSQILAGMRLYSAAQVNNIVRDAFLLGLSAGKSHIADVTAVKPSPSSVEWPEPVALAVGSNIRRHSIELSVNSDVPVFNEPTDLYTSQQIDRIIAQLTS